MTESPPSAYSSLTFDNSVSLRVDAAVGSMSISPSGRDAVLASRRGLYIVDLDDPFSPPRWLHHWTSWEVADVQWSPHAATPYWVVSTSNQKAMVWNLSRPSSAAIEHVLHGHSRAITDINFHPAIPTQLATCSVDSFVLAWDLRTPHRAVHKFADWRAGATQVKWSYHDPHVLASAHDQNLLVWDVRNGAVPLRQIRAHAAKVNGIDFSKTDPCGIITCSNEATVKYWDFRGAAETPQWCIRTDFPVWRARHLPFGSACGIMPLRGGGNSVYVADIAGRSGEKPLEPVHVFAGHSAPVKEFLWRSRGRSADVDDREFQLVTWSKDCDLRLWPITDDVYRKVGFKRGEKPPPPSTRRGAPYITCREEPLEPGVPGAARRAFMTGTGHTPAEDANRRHLSWLSGVRIGRAAFAPSMLMYSGSEPLGPPGAHPGAQLPPGALSAHPGNLGEEISMTGHKFPKVRFESISVSTGHIVVSLNGPWGDPDGALVFLRVEIDFPPGYPARGSAPTCTIEENSALPSNTRDELVAQLQTIAKAYTDAGRFCLEPCLRCLMGEKVSVDTLTDENDDTELELGVLGSGPLLPELEASAEAERELDSAAASSDDDDELIPDVTAPAGSGPFSGPTKAALDSTPLPKGCGGVWTATGQLVCFFIPKQETRDKPGLMRFDEKGFIMGRSERRTGRRGKPGKAGSSDSDSHSEAEELGSSEEESESSSETSSEDDESLEEPVGAAGRFPGLFRPAIGFRPYRRVAAAVPSASGFSSATGGSKVSNVKLQAAPRNIVAIHDMRHLLPARANLGKRYELLGRSPEATAAMNAAVARREGEAELADCWELLAVLLVKDMPVAVSENGVQNGVQSGIRNGIRQGIRNGTEFGITEVQKAVRFYWGTHPFGGLWLTKELMGYFERLGNVQMLAMLSCMFFEHKRHRQNSRMPINSPFAAQFEGPSVVPSAAQSGHSAHSGGGAVREMRGTPSVSSERTHNSPLNQREFPFRRESSEMHVPILGPASAAQIPVNKRMGTPSSMDSIMLAESPDRMLFGPKLMPPLRARNSHEPREPREAPQLARRTSSVYSASVNSEARHHKPRKTEKTVGPRVELMNETTLDLHEDVYALPLLDPAAESRYRRYREQYADLLFLWSLPIKRLEVLKYNYADAGESGVPTGKFREHVAHIGWRFPSAEGKVTRASVTSLEGNEHGRIYQDCNFCGLKVRKRFFLCTKCEHLQHADCAAEWWGDGNVECPSGCGCECLKNTM